MKEHNEDQLINCLEGMNTEFQNLITELRNVRFELDAMKKDLRNVSYVKNEQVDVLKEMYKEMKWLRELYYMKNTVPKDVRVKIPTFSEPELKED